MSPSQSFLSLTLSHARTCAGAHFAENLRPFIIAMYQCYRVILLYLNQFPDIVRRLFQTDLVNNFKFHVLRRSLIARFFLQIFAGSCIREQMNNLQEYSTNILTFRERSRRKINLFLSYPLQTPWHIVLITLSELLYI